MQASEKTDGFSLISDRIKITLNLYKSRLKEMHRFSSMFSSVDYIFLKKRKKRGGFSTPKGAAGWETCLGIFPRGAAGIP
jgi:hypothetical protein